MTSIKKLIYDVKKKCDYNILDSIIIEELNNDKSKILISNFYEECIDSKFANINKVMKYINHCNKCIKIYSNISNISINLYYKKNNNSIFKLIKIYKRILILSQIYNIDKKITFHLALCSFKRYMPNKNCIFDTINFNGGFTNINGNDIYIHRNCEYSKVILHELFHHVNIINDSTMTINNYDINKIKKNFNISSHTILLPNESIIEFWATIYNLIFISCEYNINFELLYKKELDFSYNQFLKILNHNKNNEWYEKTNIFCYFILKYILLKNYKKFLKVKLPYNSKEFIDFLINNSKNVKIINKYNVNNNLNAMIFSSF
jgi:hypothetical protein|tara:strand:+ start:7080 stop:8036 length:957 start_codon:yes stop_codon:yes gene_type:complete